MRTRTWGRLVAVALAVGMVTTACGTTSDDGGGGGGGGGGGSGDGPVAA